MENIRLFFVLPEKYSSEKEASEIMVQAYEVGIIELCYLQLLKGHSISLFLL